MKKFLFYILLSAFVSSTSYIYAIDPEYELIDLNIISRHAGGLVINNNGIIAGQESEHNNVKSFVFDFLDKNLTYLGSLDGLQTHIFDINNKDEVIGYSYLEEYEPNKGGRYLRSHPFIWNKETGIIDLFNIFSETSFLKMNDFGFIMGESTTLLSKITDTYTAKRSSFILNRNTKSCTIINYPNKYGPDNYCLIRVNSINNKCDTCGTISYGGSPSTGFAFFRNGITNKIIPLDSLGGNEKYYSQAIDINDNQQIVGVSETSQKHKYGFYYEHACLWDNGNPIDLGALSPEDESVARAINNHSTVLGMSNGQRSSGKHSQPFIWDPIHGMRNLNTLIDNPEIKLEDVSDINDRGQIVGHAIVNNEQHIVLLNPIIKK